MGADGATISKAETSQVSEDRKQTALRDGLGWRRPQASTPMLHVESVLPRRLLRTLRAESIGREQKRR